MDKSTAEQLVARQTYWHHRWEIFPGVVTPGVYEPVQILKNMDWPADMTGWRVLDVGACDGYFSFQAAMRGADVTAFDFRSKTQNGFAIAEAINGRELRYVQDNVMNLPQVFAGEQFDMILFLGVLYHLPDPLGALWSLRLLCQSALYLETIYSDDKQEAPLMRYLPGASFANDITNFWSPNLACLKAMLEDTGFELLTKLPDTQRVLMKDKPSTPNGRSRKMSIAGQRRFSDQ